MAKIPGTLSIYPIRVDPHHDRRHGSVVAVAPMLPRHHHQHPEWRLDPDEVDWGKFGRQVLDASYSVLPNLREISLAPTFNRLTVLSVRASGLISLDLLQSCAKLVHLDLSSNRITDLGGGDFWASFPDLLVVLLHGNMVCLDYRCIYLDKLKTRSAVGSAVDYCLAPQTTGCPELVKTLKRGAQQKYP